MKKIFTKFSLYKKWIKHDYDFIIQIFKSAFHKKRVFLFDTADHDNLGDHAISIAVIEFINRYLPEYVIIEVPGGNVLRHTCLYKIFVKKEDLIAIPGGGFLGDIWPYEEKIVQVVMNNFSKNRVIIFPQTFFVEEPEKYIANHSEYLRTRRLLICLRDLQSYERIKSFFPTISNCIMLVPDMVCMLACDNNMLNREGVGFCFRIDKEKVTNEKLIDSFKLIVAKKNIPICNISTIAKYNISCFQRNDEVKKILNEFASKKLIITDRLHAMLFSAITATPCIAFDNKSKKVSGVYEWIKELPYIKFVDDESDFISILNSIDLEQKYNYPSNIFDKYWTQIAETIRSL